MMKTVRGAARVPQRIARYLLQLWRDGRPAAKRHNISLLRILREQVALKLKNKIQPLEYFLYELDDPRKSWEEKRTYIGGDLLRKVWYVMTPLKYQYLFKNKLTFKRVFGAMGLPVARLYGVYDPVWGRSAEGAPLQTAEDIAAWMTSKEAQVPVFKPVESAEGQMVLVMRERKQSDPTKFIGLDGTEYSPERIVAFLNDPERLRQAYPPSEYARPLRSFLMEQRLRPHPTMKEFSPETLCCARILTLTTLAGQVDIIETSVKLQPNDSGVDNVSRGAVGVAVDPETGVLGSGLMGCDSAQERRTNLPGTGKRFAGFQMPLWKEAIALAKAAATVFPQAHTVGWDIAFTDQGLFLVEGNAAWGDWQAECQQGLMKGAFKEVYEALR